MYQMPLYTKGVCVCTQIDISVQTNTTGRQSSIVSTFREAAKQHDVL